MRLLKKLQMMLIFYLAASSTMVLAHGGDDRHLQLVVQPNTVRLSVLILADQLVPFDRDADGRLSHDEFRAQFDQLNIYLNEKLRLATVNGLVLQPTISDLNIVDSTKNHVKAVRVRRTYTIQRDPAHYLAVGLDIRPDRPLAYRIIAPDKKQTGVLNRHNALLKIPPLQTQYGQSQAK